MKKSQLSIYHKVPIIPAALLAGLCWTAALFQSLPSINLFAHPQSIPAFQSEVKDIRKDSSSCDFIPAFKTGQTIEYSLKNSSSLTKENADTPVSSLCSFLDADCQKISSHEEEGYTDYYYYSPLLEEKYQIHEVRGSNIQVALTWDKNGNLNHVYMGFPNIDYDF